jgi:hypothetical protein
MPLARSPGLDDWARPTAGRDGDAKDTAPSATSVRGEGYLAGTAAAKPARCIRGRQAGGKTPPPRLRPGSAGTCLTSPPAAARGTPAGRDVVR